MAPKPQQEVAVWPPPSQQQAATSGTPELKIVQFGANAKRVRAGQKARLSWSVEGAASVAIAPSVGGVEAQGSTEVAVDRTTEFTLTAKTITGEATESKVVVEVGPAAASGPVALKVQFAAQPSTIASGQSATLRWSAPGARSVDIEPGVGAVPASGSRHVSPARQPPATAWWRAGATARRAQPTPPSRCSRRSRRRLRWRR